MSKKNLPKFQELKIAIQIQFSRVLNVMVEKASFFRAQFQEIKNRFSLADTKICHGDILIRGRKKLSFRKTDSIFSICDFKTAFIVTVAVVSYYCS